MAVWQLRGGIARLHYLSLYRMRLIGVHGWLKAIALIMVGHVNRVVRPRLKFHEARSAIVSLIALRVWSWIARFLSESRKRKHLDVKFRPGGNRC